MSVKAEKQTVKYRKFRQEIFDRDGHKCECGNTEWLRLYHPDESVTLLYVPSNAETVCRGCYFKKCSKMKQSDKPGRGYSRFLVIKVKVLSEVSGLCKETVRRHIRDKKFDPWDLKSIKDWLNNNSKPEKEDLCSGEKEDLTKLSC